jgi:hypothetical protein
MTKILRILTIAVAITFVFFGTRSATAADSFVAAPNQRFEIDLDTAAGAFSNWAQDDIGAFSALRAIVSIPRLRQDPQWLPVFTMDLQDKTSTNGLGFRISTPNRAVPLTLSVIKFGAAGATEVGTFKRTLNLSETIDVEIRWSRAGVITIGAGPSETQTFHVPWQVSRLAVSASTAEAKVQPLTLGSVGIGK